MFSPVDLNANEVKKYAIIIAVGEYHSESGWPKINSANDVQLIKTTLIKQNFTEDHIKVLIDNQATKQNIIEAFRDLSNMLRMGDIVFFHYSGHGQQIMDDNGDELDGFDETLIPFDADMVYEKSKSVNEKHLRDDLLGLLLDKIRLKIGPKGDLIVVLDACHSGTATRNFGISRGTELKFAPSEYQPPNVINHSSSTGFNETVHNSSLSPIVIFSGSSASEQNYEYVHNQISYGSLSFALCSVLSQNNETISYRSLFAKVQALMRTIVPRQSPQLEGDADRTLFAGMPVVHQEYFLVKSWRDPQHVIIHAGILNGLNNNSHLEFHPVGTIKGANVNAVVKGEVVLAQLSEALVKLESSVNKDDALKLCAFPTSFTFVSSVLSVQLSSNLDDILVKSLKESLKNYSIIKLVNYLPDLLIDTDNSNKGIVNVFTRDEHLIKSIETAGKSNTTVISHLIDALQQHLQAQLLRDVTSKNNRVAVSFELIPVMLDQQFREISRQSMASRRNNFGQLIFEGGGYFKIKITNSGNRQAFYTLIDIQPDNMINVLIPEKDALGNLYRSPSDCKINPGQSEELKAIFYFKEPYGQEVFKLVSANKPLNLDQVFNTRGAISNEVILDPFEILFANSFHTLSRNSESYSLPPEFINIESLVFEVKPVGVK